MPQITADQLRSLERSYRYGRSSWKAAQAAGVEHRTASRHYLVFERAHIPRLNRIKTFSHRHYDHAPAYDGPEWIGQADGPAPEPKYDGNWIF